MRLERFSFSENGMKISRGGCVSESLKKLQMVLNYNEARGHQVSLPDGEL